MAGKLAEFWASTYAERAPEYFIKKSWCLDPFSDEELAAASKREAYINISRVMRIISGLSMRADSDPQRQTVSAEPLSLAGFVRDAADGFKAMKSGEIHRSRYEGVIGKTIGKKMRGFLLQHFNIVGEPLEAHNFRFTKVDADRYIEPLLKQLRYKMHVTAIEHAKPVIKPEPVPLFYKWFGNERQKQPFVRKLEFGECFVKKGDVLDLIEQGNLPDGGKTHEAYSRGNDWDYEVEKTGEEIMLPLNYKRALIIAVLMCEDRTDFVERQTAKEACEIYKPRMTND